MSRTGEQIITIQTMTNISRRKGNQIILFGQLIEYNRNIFLKKSCSKYGGIPDSFLDWDDWTYFWTKSLKFCTDCFYSVLFIVCPSRDLLKLKCKATPLFCALFLKKKNHFALHSINLPTSIVWVPLFLWIMCIVIVCFPDCDVINFKTNLSFLISPYPQTSKK